MYSQRVFKENIEEVEPNTEDTSIVQLQAVIPENTLYEESLILHNIPNKKRMTVFGFTRNNLEKVIRK